VITNLLYGLTGAGVEHQPSILRAEDLLLEQEVLICISVTGGLGIKSRSHQTINRLAIIATLLYNKLFYLYAMLSRGPGAM